MMKKTISVVLLSAMLFTLITAGTVANADTEYAEWVYSATPGDLETADPYGSTTARTMWLTNMTFDTLVYNNAETGEIDPELAYKWESNEAQDEWTFWLRDDVYFHNGDHMTAEDVKFTYLFTANLNGEVNVIKASEAGSFAESVEILDDYTIKFVLKKPRADFPTYMEMKVYSKNAIETLGLAEGGVIGTGPYYFDRENTIPAQIYTVTRNENYWGGTENYKTKHIGFKVYGDWNGVIAALEAGDIDFTTIQGIHYNTVSNDPDLVIEEKAGSSVYYVGFNYTSANADFYDKEIRTAIAQCINKDDLVLIAWEGLAMKADNMCAPSGLGFSPDVKGPSYDPEAGAATLRSKNIKDLTVIYTSGAPAIVAEVLQASLKSAGITVNLRQVDTTNWASFKMAREGYDLMVDYLSYSGALLNTYTRFLTRTGSANFYAYNSDEFEAMLNKVDAQSNWDDMVKEFLNLQQWVADESPLIPLTYANQLLGRDANVGGGYLASTNGRNDWSTIYKIVK